MRCNKTFLPLIGVSATAIAWVGDTALWETLIWQKSCHTPNAITAQPGTSPLSPGRYVNGFITAPFSALPPQDKKGCQWSGEVIPKFGGRLSRLVSPQSRRIAGTEPRRE